MAGGEQNKPRHCRSEVIAIESPQIFSQDRQVDMRRKIDDCPIRAIFYLGNKKISSGLATAKFRRDIIIKNSFGLAVQLFDDQTGTGSKTIQ
jgi:hypothetical protein